MKNISLLTDNAVATQPATITKADIAVRVGAFFIDHLLVSCVYLSLAIPEIFKRTDHKSLAASLSSLIFPAFLLYLIKDIVRGASIGKRLFGLAVRDARDPLAIPSPSRLLLRNVFTCLWPLELIALNCSASKRKIGDKFAGTDVYKIPKKKIAFLSLLPVSGSYSQLFSPPLR